MIMSTSAVTQNATTTWNIDPAHSVVEFKVKHMMISNVKGSFAKVTGTLTLNRADLSQSKVEAEIDVSSIDTRDAQRDGHLKSADFFHADEHATMRFVSTKVDAAAHEVEGDLTIKGVTKKVVFDVEGPTGPAKDPWGNERVAASATTKISRKEFGLTWNAALETGGVLVGDEVTITLDVQFVKAA